ncbi:type VI secretion system tube protein TssD [Aquimarina muelleri]|uniref:Uncharacterized protein n=1 Tax=Aquimarina muelleri TaxID=279356 RepID=A0A918N401_9FLAO|nr:type VI secretion system tube protein TssD [Aquimarina muelleri]MCX2761763.1 type VI secretion system tube protein TssD [Aquimarina muelleri]GGX16003.1 hypothetical protein GCM10007384_16940 [Aquimarina muelleri]
MIKAKLFVLGTERELLWTDLEYSKTLNHKTGRCGEIPMGGLVTLAFSSGYDDDRLLRWMTHNPENEFCTLTECKIIFYEGDFDGVTLFEYKFNDAALIYWKEKFTAVGEKPMSITMTISAAIQEVKGITLVKPWQESWMPPSERIPYQPLDNEEKKQYFVEKVEVIELDEGSTNGDTNSKMGLIYGKEYTLKIVKFRNDEIPSNLNQIKWGYTYDPDDGSAFVGTFKETGEKVTFKTDDLELCGKTITFYAYIEKKENEAELEVFHHNRFRWFNRQIVEQQIEERIKKPWKINQGGTSLCGMACLFYIFAKNDKHGYKKFAETLHRKGKAVHNGYTVEPDEDAKKEMYDTNPTTSKEHPWIPEIDWITMATTRSKESDFGYTGKKGQDASAINWPWLMTNLSKKLLGYTTVKMDYYKVNKSYIRDFFGSDEKIRILEEDIDNDYQNGYEICMMIDGDMISNKSDYDITDLGEYHWVTYEGGLEILNGINPETDYDKVTNINFNVVTWGEIKNGTPNEKPKLELSKKAYRNNYYGYLKLK